jgi:hypothetical protein
MRALRPGPDRPPLGYLIGNLVRYAMAIIVGVAIWEAVVVVLNLGAGAAAPSAGAVVGAFVFGLTYYIAVGLPLALVYLVLLKRLRLSMGLSRLRILLGTVVVGIMFVLLLFGTSVTLLGPEGILPLIPWLLFGALIRPPSVEPAAPVTSRP